MLLTAQNAEMKFNFGDTPFKHPPKVSPVLAAVNTGTSTAPTFVFFLELCSDEVLVWLSVWSEVQIVCIWSS